MRNGVTTTKIHDPHEGISPDGMIVTGAYKSRIVRRFQPVLDSVINQVELLNNNCSLYVYGSVAMGTARVQQSDVDLVALGMDEETGRTLSESLSAEFCDLCRGVEIVVGNHSSYIGSDNESYGNRVFLRHYCVHLIGSDVTTDWPAFPADQAAARGFNGDIGNFANTWREQLKNGEELESLARRIGRKTLPAVSGLVSIHDHIWTTDRNFAARRWGEVKPEISEELEMLCTWGNTLSPKVSFEEIVCMLDGAVTEVVADFNQRIGLWTP